MKIFFVAIGLVLATFIDWDLVHLLGPRLQWHLNQLGLAFGLFVAFSVLAAFLWWGAFYIKAEEHITPFQVYCFLLLLSTATYLGIRLNYSPITGLHQDMEIYVILTLAIHLSYLCPPLYAVARPRQ